MLSLYTTFLHIVTKTAGRILAIELPPPPTATWSQDSGTSTGTPDVDSATASQDNGTSTGTPDVDSATVSQDSGTSTGTPDVDSATGSQDSGTSTGPTTPCRASMSPLPSSPLSPQCQDAICSPRSDHFEEDDRLGELHVHVCNGATHYWSWL